MELRQGLDSFSGICCAEKSSQTWGCRATGNSEETAEATSIDHRTAVLLRSRHFRTSVRSMSNSSMTPRMIKNGTPYPLRAKSYMHFDLKNFQPSSLLQSSGHANRVTQIIDPAAGVLVTTAVGPI